MSNYFRKQRHEIGVCKLDHEVNLWHQGEKTQDGYLIDFYVRLISRLTQKGYDIAFSLRSSEMFLRHMNDMGFDRNKHIPVFTGEALGRACASIDDIIIVPRGYNRIFPIANDASRLLYVTVESSRGKCKSNVYSFTTKTYIKKRFHTHQEAHYYGLNIRINDIEDLLKHPEIIKQSKAALNELKTILHSVIANGLAYVPRKVNCTDNYFAPKTAPKPKSGVTLQSLCKGRHA